MSNSWKNKVAGKNLIGEHFTLAPEWYIEAKENGATKQEIFELVREFCLANAEDETIDDSFVELMIDTYEA